MALPRPHPQRLVYAWVCELTGRVGVSATTGLSRNASLRARVPCSVGRRLASQVVLRPSKRPSLFGQIGSWFAGDLACTKALRDAFPLGPTLIYLNITINMGHAPKYVARDPSRLSIFRATIQIGDACLTA